MSQIFAVVAAHDHASGMNQDECIALYKAGCPSLCGPWPVIPAVCDRLGSTGHLLPMCGCIRCRVSYIIALHGITQCTTSQFIRFKSGSGSIAVSMQTCKR